MTVRSFLSSLVGALMVVLGFAWAIFDASNHLGRIGLTTALGALALTAAGGVLISKSKTIELFKTIFSLGRDARAVVKDLPVDGSGVDA